MFGLVDVKTVIQQYGLEIESSGSNVVEKGDWYQAICPFHNDTDPSLKFKEGDKQAWCFTCGKQRNSRQILNELNKYRGENEKLSADFIEEIVTGIDNNLIPKLEKFADYKGLDLEFLKRQGWRDSTKEDNFSKGVVMPFVDFNGEHLTYKIRVKYRGKDKYSHDPVGKNKGLMYGINKLKNFYDKEKTVYLCEGETDVVTLMQAGLQSVGICGASAWRDEFTSYLDGFKDIVLVMDMDDAGRELALKMKNVDMDIIQPPAGKDINDYYCEICGKDKERFVSDMASMPRYTLRKDRYIEKLKENKKFLKDKKGIEILLSTGHDAMDIEELICDIAENTDISKSVAKSMIKKVVDIVEKTDNEIGISEGVSVVEEGAGYMKQVRTMQRYADIPLTNFTIKVNNIMLEDAGSLETAYNVYYATLINQIDGNKAEVMFTPDDIANQTKFEKVCTGRGFKLWLRNGDFPLLRDKILDQKAPILKKSNKIGYVDGKWLFGNCGIDSKGNFIKEKNGMINLDGTEYIVCCEEEVAEFDKEVELLPDTCKELVEDLKTCWGSYNTWTMLGWHTATLFSHEIYDRYKVFPINFMTGIRNSGKTALGRIVNRWFGFNEDEKTMETTVPALRAMLNERVSLPLFLDEYDPAHEDSKLKTTVLKGVGYRSKKAKYNKDHKMVILGINGTLLLAGQKMPTVAAITDRCAVSRYSEYTRELKDLKEQKDLIEKIEGGIDQHRALTLDICRKVMDPEEVKKILTEIDEFQKILIAENISHRIYKNIGILAGAFLYMYKSIISENERKSYIEHIIRECKVLTQDVSDADTVGGFFNTFVTKVNMGKFVSERPEAKSIYHPAHFVVRQEEDNGPRIAYIRLSEVVNILNKETADVFDYTTIAKDISQEPFYIEDESKKMKRFKKDYEVGPSKYVAIDIDKLKVKSEQAYEMLSEFVNYTKEEADNSKEY